jgi:hypothetical protein
MVAELTTLQFSGTIWHRCPRGCKPNAIKLRIRSRRFIALQKTSTGINGFRGLEFLNISTTDLSRQCYIVVSEGVAMPSRGE